MLIKLNVEGELLECLKKDAEINCRTNPQQILYYLRQIYNGQLSVSNNTQLVQIEVPTLIHEGQDGTNDIQINNNEDTNECNKSNLTSTHEEPEEIDDEVLNF